MRIERFEIEKELVDIGQQEARPFARVTVDDQGCDLPGCNCSPKNFISVSDGKIGIVVELTALEAQQLKDTGRLDITVA